MCIYIYMYMCPPLDDHPRPLKTRDFNNFGGLWVYQGLLGMLRTIVSTFHFGKRTIAREMTSFRSHFVSASLNSYWWHFPNSAVWSSPGLIFGLLLLPWSGEIQRWVYQLWRMDGLLVNLLTFYYLYCILEKIPLPHVKPFVVVTALLKLLFPNVYPYIRLPVYLI